MGQSHVTQTRSLTWTWAVAALTLTGIGWCAEAKRPTIVVFISDDHGVDFVGCYGNQAVHTPNMDQLAREGMRFDRVFAASPTCSPSRAVMFTGMYPARNGTMGNHTDCRPDIRSLPTYLQALGYRVVAADKTDVRPPSVFPWETIRATLPNNPNLKRIYRGEGLDTAKVDSFLASHSRDHPDQPLCLLIGDNAPHEVWEPNRDFDPASLPIPPIMVDTPKTRAALANYYQDISTTDRHLGEVMASLKKHGFMENTVLIYTTDQGAEWPHCKWTCYDTGLRVPFIVRWPGVVKPGSANQSLISFADLTPTFVDLAGGAEIAGLDGRSFKALLMGRTREINEFIFASHTGDGTMNMSPQRCIRDSRWKYIINLRPDQKWTTHFTLVMDIPGSHGDVYQTWIEKAAADPAVARLVDTIEHHPAVELYDTEADPYELNNLAGRRENAERVARLRAQLTKWLKQQDDKEALAAIR
jgi:arylsulfatase A-like enzyme